MKKSFSFLFFGTPEFASIILDKLIGAGFMPQAVVCNPDRPIGRKQIITPPPTKILVKIRGLENKIKILQPEKFDSNFMLQVSNFKPDLFVVAAYARILPKKILDIPRLGSIGIHPSLLPKYRGASPIQATILAGDKETGTTLYLMDEKVDHGPILAQKALENCELRIINYESLIRKLAELSGDLLIQTLSGFLAGEIKPKMQDELLATYTKKFRSEDAYIEPTDLEKAEKDGVEIAAEIDRKVRALNPEPGAWTVKDGKRMKVLEAEIKDKKLKLKKIQMEGKNPADLNTDIL